MPTEAISAIGRASLLFRSEQLSRQLTAAPDLAKDYYPVLSWPAAEAGSGPQEAADAFVAHTHTAEWQKAVRRGLRPGDAMVYLNRPHLFADEERAQHFARNGRPVVRLTRWLHLWLIDFSTGNTHHERTEH